MERRVDSARTGAAGVMLMAYGAPVSLDDVAGFFTDIRGGRRPPDDRIEELKGRYRMIGGGASLLEITNAQARALEAALGAGGERIPVFVGMRHAPPFIRERVAEVAASGVKRLVGLALAPHFSSLSVGAYHLKLTEAVATLASPPELRLVDEYHAHPLFVAALAETLSAAMDAARGAGRGPIRVLFTAHSLPERIVLAGEPYRDQLLETARLVAAKVGVPDWEFAFQSASPTGEPWLGPDILVTMRRLAAEGRLDVVVQPVGFVSDHLEILYDLDILCRGEAERLGVRFRRAESLNARPAFIAALASVVRERLAATPAGRASRA
ncbi:MAG: ferrochelatase [Acidobacteria bacterium]|nr:ferrochelatase [Acidobacteriota bacterium]